MHYRRYVDDVFAIFKNEDEASNFLKYLNTHHKNIQFTMDTESDKKLSFLDVVVHKLDDGFGTEWAVKSTNTGVYTPKEAFSPFRYKTAAIRALIYRAKHLCSNNHFYEKSFEKILFIFMQNGYNQNFINKIKQKVDNAISQNSGQNSNLNISYTFWKLPYVKEKEKETLKTVHVVNRVLPENHKLSVVFKTFKTRSCFSLSQQRSGAY